MTVGLATPRVMPPRPEPTTSAISGLNPASFASKNSFVSFTFAIIGINLSLDLLYDQRQSRVHRFVFDPISTSHHALSLGAARLVIIMHDHQRFAGFHRVTDLFRLFESHGKINLVRRYLATAAERDHRIPNLVAFDRLHNPRFCR